MSESVSPTDAHAEDAPQMTASSIGEMFVALKQAGDTGASWFYWIAALSLVNTAILQSGGDRHFVIGLAVTTVVDAIAAAIGQQHPDAASLARGLAIGFSVCVSIVVVLFGWLSRKRLLWVFGLGMALYLLDGLLYLYFQDFLSAGFHAYVLFAMSRGYSAYRQMARLDAALADHAAALQTVTVTTDD